MNAGGWEAKPTTILGQAYLKQKYRSRSPGHRRARANIERMSADPTLTDRYLDAWIACFEAIQEATLFKALTKIL